MKTKNFFAPEIILLILSLVAVSVYHVRREHIKSISAVIEEPIPLIAIEPETSDLIVEEIKITPTAEKEVDISSEHQARYVTGNGDLLHLEKQTSDMFNELEQRWGEQLEVKWAWRDKKLNDLIDGARQSQHLHGKALDITHNGWSQAKMKKFVRLAYEVGFRGFGIGQTMIHIDSRDKLGAWLYPGSPYPSARKLLK